MFKFYHIAYSLSPVQGADSINLFYNNEAYGQNIKLRGGTWNFISCEVEIAMPTPPYLREN